MNLAEWLVRSASLYPDNPALMLGDRLQADYRAFAQAASCLATALTKRHGIRPGDRIAIFAKNVPEYLVAMYGAWIAGAAIVPVNAKLHAREAAWIIDNAGASLAFVTEEPGNGLAGIVPASCKAMIDLKSAEFEAMTRGEAFGRPVARDRDDMAWLFYTSGTTGRPKGVMITHGNIHAMAFTYFIDVDAVRATDIALYAAPMSHGAGLYNVQHVLKAARHAVPQSGGFDPAEILDLSKRLGDVHMFAAPTMVRRLVDAAKSAGESGDGIRTIVYGGGPMYLADIVEAVEIMGPRFCQIYGQGESPMTITALGRDFVADRKHPRWRERLASVGTAQSCVEVAVVDAEGRPVACGETGEIIVRGASVMAGYWMNREATEATLKDGWLWTGDMGSLDEDGFLTLKDRSKDVIISGGTNIYPREVEEALLTHADVREVCVVGAPDPEWGENVVAFVVAEPGKTLTAQALDRHCLDMIARFKRPKTYRFIDRIAEKQLRQGAEDRIAGHARNREGKGMSGRLDGKVALVTGCGSAGPGWGNGKAIAALFAREGASVMGCDIRLEAAEETREIIRGEGGTCEVMATDVSKSDEVAALVEATVTKFGGVDILVNNVGIVEVGGPVEYPEEKWRRALDINITSMFLAAKYALPHMEKAGGGSIVNIGSIAGIRYTGVPYISYYTTKAAVLGFSRGLALEYAGRNIRSNTIMPGLMNTPMIVEPLKGVYGAGSVEKMIETRDAQCPMGHMGDAWDVAEAALYLASDAAKYVTAAELVVDGGITAKFA